MYFLGSTIHEFRIQTKNYLFHLVFVCIICKYSVQVNYMFNYDERLIV